MKIPKRKSILAFMLAVMVVIASGCVNILGTESHGVQGGNFAEHSSLSKAFSTDGNTTVTLSGDELI